MKIGIIVVMLVVLPSLSFGQSLAQDIEQLALDYKKLSQLKHMLQDMYTAYTEIHAGYEQVRGIAEGNFNLHKAFLDALLAVSPVVRDYVKVVHIIDNERELVKEYQQANSYFRNSGKFSSYELDYLNTMYGNLLNGSLANLDELTRVLTPGELRMSDAERLTAIDRIDRDMTDKLNYLRVFNNNGAIQAGQRGLELNDLNTMRGLNGIGN